MHALALVLDQVSANAWPTLTEVADAESATVVLRGIVMVEPVSVPHPFSREKPQTSPRTTMQAFMAPPQATVPICLTSSDCLFMQARTVVSGRDMCRHFRRQPSTGRTNRRQSILSRELKSAMQLFPESIELPFAHFPTQRQTTLLLTYCENLNRK